MNRLLLILACIAALLIPTTALCWMNVVTLGGGTPAAGGDECPTGTYILFWDGDLTDGEEYACISSGSSTEDASATDGTDRVSAATTGKTGNSFHYSDDGQYITWTETVPEAAGTIYADFRTTNEDKQPYVIELYIDATNKAYFRIKNNQRVYIGWTHNGTLAEQDSGEAIVTNDAWYTVGISWNESTGYLAVTDDGGSNWYASDRTIGTDMSGDFTTITMGSINATFGDTDTHETKNLFVLSGYQAARPTP